MSVGLDTFAALTLMRYSKHNRNSDLPTVKDLKFNKQIIMNKFQESLRYRGPVIPAESYEVIEFQNELPADLGKYLLENGYL